MKAALMHNAETNQKVGTAVTDVHSVSRSTTQQLSAEVFNPEKLVWENPHQRPNHFWDCEVMALVCAWELGIRNWEAPQEDADAQPAPMAAPATVPTPLRVPSMVT